MSSLGRPKNSGNALFTIIDARNLAHNMCSVQDFELRHLGRLDVLDADLSGELLDHAEQVRPGGGAGFEGFADLTLVTALADVDVEGDFAEERDAKLLGLAPGAALAEDVNALIAGRFEGAAVGDQLLDLRAAALGQVRPDVEEAHVLDHSQERHLELAEHRDGAHGVE